MCRTTMLYICNLKSVVARRHEFKFVRYVAATHNTADKTLFNMQRNIVVGQAAHVTWPLQMQVFCEVVQS